MPKKTIDLDTPFKRGETVITTRAHRNIPDGAEGKVKLINGLETLDGVNPWIRYWVRFKDHGLVGQISHEGLTRPSQFGAWLDREEEPVPAAAAVGAGDGIASQIPAHLLERSRAAKARLLGS